MTVGSVSQQCLFGRVFQNDFKEHIKTMDISLEEVSDPASIINDSDYRDNIQRKRALLLNLAWICLVWVFTFTAYSGLQNLEASLVPDIGVYSLAAITGGGLISCIVAPAVIQKIGAKGALITSWICLAIFVGANYYPKPYILLPGAAIEGISTGLMWTAQGAFVTTIAMEYSVIIQDTLDAVLSRFFGIFCMAFQSTQIWGNIISSAVLHEGGPPTVNTSSNSSSQPPPSYCGADDCPWDDKHNKTSGPDLPQWRVYTLISIYLGFTVIGLIITVFLLKPIKSAGSSSGVSIGRQLLATLRLLVTNLNMVLLVPLSIWTGMEQVILFAEFTKVRHRYAFTTGAILHCAIQVVCNHFFHCH